MKILLCSPYLDTPDVFPGGIGIWARNILGFAHFRQCDVQITPVSFDRRYSYSAKAAFFYRCHYGIEDYLNSIYKARKKLASGQYDILHLCTSAQLGLLKDLCVLRMARRYGAKSVIHLHFGRTPELFRKRNWEYRMLVRACRMADSIIVIDRQSEKTLRAAGFQNVCYLPNPIAQESLQQVKAMDGLIEREPGKLVFVGRATRTKGAMELVGACRQFDGIELYVIGLCNPVTCQEMKEMASDKHNGGWMRLMGQLSHDEVLKEMMSAGIFVFPSYTEGFPNVILEAMACGCPIVTTAVGAIPEMLNVGEEDCCGICVEPQNTQALAAALGKMLSDRGFATRCAERARKRVNELYAIPLVWEQLTQIWKNAFK